jgi:hypothetical protein
MSLTYDGRRFIRDQQIKKTLVCEFNGEAYSAEREDGSLKIYLNSAEGVESGVIADGRAAPSISAAELQRRNLAWRERQKGLR